MTAVLILPLTATVEFSGAIQQLQGTNSTTLGIIVIEGTNNKQCNIDEYISEF